MINLLPPNKLTPRQLIDEYNDCLMIVARAAKYYASRSRTPLPVHYTLDTRRHFPFFYQRLGWLEQRFLAVVGELKRHGVVFDHEYLPSVADHLPDDWWQQWEPTDQDVQLSLQKRKTR